jgi:uncharacterized damage-inducible protein DinB
MQPAEQGDSSVITALFHHNAWANLKLLEFCQSLTDEQLDTTAIGGYGTIRDTLIHTIGAEVSYVERVNGRTPPIPLPKGPQAQWPGFDALEQAARWAADELLQLALAARAGTRVHQRPPRQNIEYQLADLMVQAITHSCEHRTQIATILTHLGLEPPDMSTWHYMEDMGTLEDFEVTPPQA